MFFASVEWYFFCLINRIFYFFSVNFAKRKKER